MANEEPGTTDKPTAAMPTTSSEVHGLIEPEPALTNPSSIPQKDDVGNTPQQALASGVLSTATAPQDSSHILIDDAITDAIENASTSVTKAQNKFESTKSKGVVASDRGRKRDHDTMTNATGPAKKSGGSVKQASRSVPTRDSSNTFPSTKFRPILPKATGPTQPGTVGRGQGNQPLDGPGQSQHGEPISGAQTASESNQRLEELMQKVPSLSEQDLAWLPADLRDMASNAPLAVDASLAMDDRLRELASQTQEAVKASMILNDQWNKMCSHKPAGRELGPTNKGALLDEWITLRQDLIEVATAAREGRQPIWPCTNQPHSNSQSMNRPPNMQQSQDDFQAPTISGPSLFRAEQAQIEKMSEDIDLAMRISLRNERVRQMQLAQLHDLLANQNYAQAQGFQDLQSAQRKADEAWHQEADNISKLIKKRSELLNKKDG